MIYRAAVTLGQHGTTSTSAAVTHPGERLDHPRAANSSSNVAGYLRVGQSAARPVAGVHAKRGRRSSLVMTAHS